MGATSHHNRAETALLSVLPRAARARRTVDGVGVGGQLLDVEWVGEGQLGDVAPLLAARRPKRNLVVVARRLSPGARAALSDAGIAWVDETGAAEIAIDTIVVSRTGVVDKPVPKPAGWAPAVLAVAEAALVGVKPTASAMQEATGLSVGSCVNGLKVLTEFGLLEASATRGRHSARRVTDPDRFLSAYAIAAPALTDDLRLEVGVTWRDFADGLKTAAHAWKREGIEYAATGVLAAGLIAPLLTTIATVEVYVSAETIVGLEAVALAAKLKPITGGRLVLRPFPTVSANRLSTNVDGLRVAPWPRVYVDLEHAGVRGEEAAEHLKEVVGRR
ncbi:MAG: hypothetical protein AB7L13_07255 [Acidimicrobiia bacterium]